MLCCFIFRSLPFINGKLLLPLSLVIQAYAIGHITYYRWKYQQQDNRIHVFTISMEMHGESDQDPESSQQQEILASPNVNTQSHNEILYGIKDMFFLALAIGIILISCIYLSNLWKEDYNGLYSFMYYIHEFFPLFVLNIMFPCYFYLCNPTARKYFKELVFKE